MMAEMPKAEKKIAQVILDQPKEIVNMKASELGEKSNTSAATVIRLCKRLEVPSFTQLKVLISRELAGSESGTTLEYSDFQPEEPLNDTIDKLLGNAYLTMKDTVSLLDQDKIKNAVQELQEAEIIYVFGVGASQLVAKNIVHKWGRVGKLIFTFSDPHQMIASMGSTYKKAAFIGISNKGETKEVIQLMDLANKYNYTTISITQFGKNRVAERADISIHHVRANEAAIRSAATSSLHAQFLVVDILFFSYASKDYDIALERILQSREDIKKYND